MTFTDEIADPPNVVGQKLASAVFNRLPMLTDELLKCVLKQGEACGNQSDIYGDDRLTSNDDVSTISGIGTAFAARAAGEP
jgi:hypothetical protein